MDNIQKSNNTVLFFIKRIFGFILLFALACVFFYSAYSKCGVSFQQNGFLFKLGNWNVPNLLPYYDSSFDNFQWSFLDLGINNILLTGILARMMIGFELLLGLFLIFHIFLKSFTYKAIITILIVFILYLIVIILKQGNNGNCGCFGNQLAMTPRDAIIKNIVMIAIAFILLFIYPVKPYKWQEYICLFLGLVAFSLPFVLNPIYTSTNPMPWNQPIVLDSLYQSEPMPNVDLRKGKHIIGFMSLTCPHCKKAGYLLHIIHHEHPALPIFFVLDGPEAIEFRKKFFEETQAADVPNLFFKHDNAMNEMVSAGYDKGEPTGVPAIYWVNNGIIEYKSSYYQLDPAFMEQWAKDPKALVYTKSKK